MNEHLVNIVTDAAGIGVNCIKKTIESGMFKLGIGRSMADFGLKMYKEGLIRGSVITVVGVGVGTLAGVMIKNSLDQKEKIES